jgi:hypothetical protein
VVFLTIIFKEEIRMKKSLVVLFLLMFSGSAYADLMTIGTAQFDGSGTEYNLIYDADGPFGPITWLDYTNDATDWTAQNEWAGELDSALTINLDGYSVDWGGSSWRLPNAAGGSGYNITESEMGHLYYTDGDFDHLVASWYWSGTEYAGDSDLAGRFYMNDGYQGNVYKSSVNYGLAVRSGQVSTAPVPEPTTSLLLGIGLLGLAGITRWRKGSRC